MLPCRGGFWPAPATMRPRRARDEPRLDHRRHRAEAAVGAIAIALVGLAAITGFSIGPLLSPLPLLSAVYAACRPHSKDAATAGAMVALVIGLAAVVLAYGEHVTLLGWLVLQSIVVVLGLIVDVVLITTGVWPERERVATP